MRLFRRPTVPAPPKPAKAPRLELRRREHKVPVTVIGNRDQMIVTMLATGNPTDDGITVHADRCPTASWCSVVVHYTWGPRESFIANTPSTLDGDTLTVYVDEPWRNP